MGDIDRAEDQDENACDFISRDLEDGIFFLLQGA